MTTMESVELSAAERANFRRQGFLVKQGLFAPEELRGWEQALEEGAMEGLKRDGYGMRQVHLLSLSLAHTRFSELARDPRLIACLRPLLGTDIELQHSKIATAPPLAGQGGYPMHQDFAYFPHTNTDLVAIMIALDDMSPDNSCLRMVPGSHDWGLLDHRSEDGYFSGRCTDTRRWRPEDAVHLRLAPGDVSLHHCLTLHGSDANRSGRPRRALVFQYRAADAYQLADHVFPDTGTLVSGQRSATVRTDGNTYTLPRQRNELHPYGSAWNQIGSAVCFK